MSHKISAKIHPIHAHERMDGVRIGKIVSIDPQGVVRVDYTGSTHGPLAARMGARVAEQLGSLADWQGLDVLLVFEQGLATRPVIFDLLSDSIRPVKAMPPPPPPPQPDAIRDITIDGKTLTFDADEQIVLRCGKASITLTKAGKIIIRGAYLLNRSSGVNRIKGGSVQIN